MTGYGEVYGEVTVRWAIGASSFGHYAIELGEG